MSSGQFKGLEYRNQWIQPFLRYVQDYPHSETWKKIQGMAAGNTEAVSTLVDFLRKFDGDLVYKDLDTYRKLSDMIESRAGLYGELRAMPPPSTPDDLHKLTQLADNLDRLIQQSYEVQDKIAIYLQR